MEVIVSERRDGSLKKIPSGNLGKVGPLKGFNDSFSALLGARREKVYGANSCLSAILISKECVCFSMSVDFNKKTCITVYLFFNVQGPVSRLDLTPGWTQMRRNFSSQLRKVGVGLISSPRL